MSQKIDQNLNNAHEFFQPFQLTSENKLKLKLIPNWTRGLSMFLKTKTIALCLSVYALSLSGNAFAGAGSGGGGGAYRLENGKLVTLPEFGVLIEDGLPQNLSTLLYTNFSINLYPSGLI